MGDLSVSGTGDCIISGCAVEIEFAVKFPDETNRLLTYGELPMFLTNLLKMGIFAMVQIRCLVSALSSNYEGRFRDIAFLPGW